MRTEKVLRAKNKLPRHASLPVSPLVITTLSHRRPNPPPSHLSKQSLSTLTYHSYFIHRMEHGSSAAPQAQGDIELMQVRARQNVQFAQSPACFKKSNCPMWPAISSPRSYILLPPLHLARSSRSTPISHRIHNPTPNLLLEYLNPRPALFLYLRTAHLLLPSFAPSLLLHPSSTPHCSAASFHHRDAFTIGTGSRTARARRISARLHSAVRFRSPR